VFNKQVEIMIVLWISPPSHGKGGCDSHGAVVKGKAKRWVVTEERKINNSAELVDYINNNVDNTFAFLVNVTEEEMTIRVDATAVKENLFFYNFEKKKKILLDTRNKVKLPICVGR
jgi:hypothetical protein